MARRAIDALLGLLAPSKIEDVPPRQPPLRPNSEEYIALLGLATALNPNAPNSIAPYFQELKAAALKRQQQRTEDDL